MPEYFPTGRALIDPFAVLDQAGLREGMKVADLGVGAVGHFLFPAAKLVGPKGQVYAVDILKSVLEANESRLKLSGGGDNVEFVWGDIDRLGGTRLPDASMDLALLANVIHLAKRDGKMIEEAKRILGSGGTLVVVDWKPAGETPGLGPDPDKRLSREEAGALAEKAGFRLEKAFEAGSNHYGLVFKKNRPLDAGRRFRDSVI